MLINSQCIEGNCITGFGKILFEDNGSYEGYFKDGLKNGQGTLIEYTDEYKITTEGLFVGDRIVQGEKVMKNLKVPLEAFIIFPIKNPVSLKDSHPLILHPTLMEI